MKRFFLLCVAAGAMLAAASCQPSGQPLDTETYTYEDATDHGSFSLFAEYPTARRGAGAAIREDLMRVVDDQLAYMFSYEGDRQFPAYTGDRKDMDAFLAYYREQGLDLLERLAEEDLHEMMEAIEESGEYTEEEKESFLNDRPGWEYDFTLEKVLDTLGYTVFLSIDYVYSGGAHGGVLGQGYLTYDKKNGKRLDCIIDPDSTEQIQPLLEQGLLEYFSDSEGEPTVEELRGWLFLEEGDPIPLPAWEPAPVEDGVLFVYQQYEIAPYAFGMPAFTVPFDIIAPYLTPEAKALLKL